MSKENPIIIYQAKSGKIELKGDFEGQNIWATQANIAQVLGVDRSVITKHINNIYKEKELEIKATSAKIAQVQKEGSRTITRDVSYYSLDMIISVGYRVNSKTATTFRQWATKTLKQHLVKGYTLNKKQLAKNHKEFLKAISTIQDVLPEHAVLDTNAILELVKEFAITWQSLDAYDRDAIQTIGVSKKSVKLSASELTKAINQLREELIKKRETTELFAQEKNPGSIEGIIGSVMQSFSGKAIYPSLEEKAAHLLYFMVKNHPFVDGNKRSGAFAFIWFLRKTKIKGARNINPASLTALTLLIAESKPDKKDQMVALVTTLLNVKK